MVKDKSGFETMVLDSPYNGLLAFTVQLTINHVRSLSPERKSPL